MRAYGVTEEMLADGKVTPEFAALMRHQVARSRAFYAEAIRLRAPEDRAAQVPSETMRRIYSGILDRIERGGYDVFRRRFRMSKLEKVWCGVVAWWGGR
jgi:phytoene synthase